jgi:hypothetical protein
LFFLGKEELKKKEKNIHTNSSFHGRYINTQTHTHRTFERTLWRRITSTRDERSKRRRCAKALCICTISKCSLIFFSSIEKSERFLSSFSRCCSHREGWYDFFANSTSVTSDGYCDDSTIGMKHVAVRDAGRESTFKPNKNNMFPRPKNWKPTKSNTHKEHFKE